MVYFIVFNRIQHYFAVLSYNPLLIEAAFDIISIALGKQG